MTKKRKKTTKLKSLIISLCIIVGIFVFLGINGLDNISYNSNGINIEKTIDNFMKKKSTEIKNTSEDSVPKEVRGFKVLHPELAKIPSPNKRNEIISVTSNGTKPYSSDNTGNDGETEFTKDELSLEYGAWKSIAKHDKYGRTQQANAMLSKDLMPTEEREPLNSTPAGYKYYEIKKPNGKKTYLYDRTHLLGFSLSGEQDNKYNLTTGTSYMNQRLMTLYENQVRNYISKGGYVRYRVTPIYRNDELVPRGIQMEAKSVSDNEVDAEPINYNVYIHNYMENVNINYKNGKPDL